MTIAIKHLSFSYGGEVKPLFDDINLMIDQNWKLGLIGRNGRGKTTFLKLLQHQLEYQGQIEATLNFMYFPIKLPDETQHTMDALQQFDASIEQWQIERELSLLSTDLNVLWRPFNSLSGGEQTKVLLAYLFTQDQAFLLIDEPTNHLDIKGRNEVAHYLRQKKTGFIVVSHDRHFIDQVVDHVISIEKNKLLLYQGNFSTYQTEKQLDDHYEQTRNTQIKHEIQRLKQTSAEKKQWSLQRENVAGATFWDKARAKRTMKRAKAIEKRTEHEINEKKNLLKNIEYIDPLKIEFVPSHHENLMTVKNLQLGYETPLFLPINFSLKKHDRLAVIGPNGSGKSSLIRYLLGRFTGSATGEVSHPQHLTISYVRQNYEDNHGKLTDFAAEQHLNYATFLNSLHKLGMPREVFTNPIEQMSMGQRKKIELAKSLSTPAELFIWDEPLNYLDIFNQEQLQQLLHSVKPTLLLVEHDQTFIDQVANKKVELKQW